MKYVRLGKSGLKVRLVATLVRQTSIGRAGARLIQQVSQIILGCMSYGVKRPKDNWTWVLEEEEALKHLKVSLTLQRELSLTPQHAYDAGINVSSRAGRHGVGTGRLMRRRSIQPTLTPKATLSGFWASSSRRTISRASRSSS